MDYEVVWTLKDSGKINGPTEFLSVEQKFI